MTLKLCPTFGTLKVHPANSYVLAEDSPNELPTLRATLRTKTEPKITDYNNRNE
jgi:hypothetical protein